MWAELLLMFYLGDRLFYFVLFPSTRIRAGDFSTINYNKSGHNCLIEDSLVESTGVRLRCKVTEARGKER